MELNLHQLIIDVASQQLDHFYNDKLVKSYPVSTAANGIGEKIGSYQTPRGWHIIRAKIGGREPIRTIFEQRRPVGTFTPQLYEQFPERDWILSRILWLSGLEVGKNRLGDCDTMRRYIYIHGAAEQRKLGVPGSKGCIRMSNEDIVELFDLIPVGTKVFIRG